MEKLSGRLTCAGTAYAPHPECHPAPEHPLHSNLHSFETTPVGRVLNRFSKDIETMEITIPEAFKNPNRNGV